MPLAIKSLITPSSYFPPLDVITDPCIHESLNMITSFIFKNQQGTVHSKQSTAISRLLLKRSIHESGDAALS